MLLLHNNTDVITKSDDIDSELYYVEIVDKNQIYMYYHKSKAPCCVRKSVYLLGRRLLQAALDLLLVLQCFAFQ